MKFIYYKDIEEMLGNKFDDLMQLSNIPMLEFGVNVFWQMTSYKEEEDIVKCAKTFFRHTIKDIYDTDIVITIIRFKWTMTNMYSSEDVLVYFLFPPDELSKKMNSILKMKAFW